MCLQRHCIHVMLQCVCSVGCQGASVAAAQTSYTRCDSSRRIQTQKKHSVTKCCAFLLCCHHHASWKTLQLSPKCRLSSRGPGGGLGLPAAQRRFPRPVMASRRAGLVCRWALKCLLWLVDSRGSASSRHQVSLSKFTSSRAVPSRADMVLVLVFTRCLERSQCGFKG